jgi:hypothetical protein
MASDSWTVLSSSPPSLPTFEQYGQRFDGTEPHFKDYKSAGFDLSFACLRAAQRLTSLVMLLDMAYLIAIGVGTLKVAMFSY